MARRILITVLAVLAAACGEPVVPVAPSAEPSVVEVHRSPTCSCCGEYEDYLRGEGFEVRRVIRDDVADLKVALGLPGEMGSCHTSLVAGYFVEGHMPAEMIRELLETTPSVDGLALPGMPPGSPGMPGDKDGAWTIYSITDGEPAEYATY